MIFTKNLRLVLGLAKGSTLRLVGSGLKCCKDLDLDLFVVLRHVQQPGSYCDG